MVSSYLLGCIYHEKLKTTSVLFQAKLEILRQAPIWFPLNWSGLLLSKMLCLRLSLVLCFTSVTDLQELDGWAGHLVFSHWVFFSLCLSSTAFPFPCQMLCCWELCSTQIFWLWDNHTGTCSLQAQALGIYLFSSSCSSLPVLSVVNQPSRRGYNTPKSILWKCG